MAYGANPSIANKLGKSLLVSELRGPDRDKTILTAILRCMMHLPSPQTLGISLVVNLPHHLPEEEWLGEPGAQRHHGIGAQGGQQGAMAGAVEEENRGGGDMGGAGGEFPVLVLEPGEELPLGQGVGGLPLGQGMAGPPVGQGAAGPPLQVVINIQDLRHRSRSLIRQWSHNQNMKLAWYLEASRGPRTLQHYCRCVIRTCMGPERLPKIACLPLPSMLKDFLLLQH